MSRRGSEKIDVLDENPVLITVVYVAYFFAMLVFYAFLWWIARDWMVMEFDQLWKPDANVGEGLSRVWFIFLWGAGVTLLTGALGIGDSRYRDHGPGETFFKGLWISTNAGVFEELIFRWLIFFSGMVTIRALNAITFNFVHWWYTELMIPLANWATFGKLEAQLMGNEWLLGAAIVSACASFRDGHKYLGIVGYINSWFMGMVFFWLMFNYGLWTAIVAHIAYDICVFSANALVSAFQPRTPNTFERISRY